MHPRQRFAALANAALGLRGLDDGRLSEWKRHTDRSMVPAGLRGPAPHEHRAELQRLARLLDDLGREMAKHEGTHPFQEARPLEVIAEDLDTIGAALRGLARRMR